jgi:hypothetical protein
MSSYIIWPEVFMHLKKFIALFDGVLLFLMFVPIPIAKLAFSHKLGEIGTILNDDRFR